MAQTPNFLLESRPFLAMLKGMAKARIAIFGLGGVGGFLGANLASFYAGGEKAEICFVARGKTLESIAANGIELDWNGKKTAARPFIATASPADIGVCDYVIFAAKTPAVGEFVKSIAPCVGPSTALVPFANGLEAGEMIAAAFPENCVASACVYIVSYITSPGRIRCDTAKAAYFLGGEEKCAPALGRLAKIMSEAGISARLDADISRRVWSKFGFISPLSTVMAASGANYGRLARDARLVKSLETLLCEFCAVAEASGEGLPPDFARETMSGYSAMMPPGSTTSMQRDFEAGRKSELESLTGWIVRRAEALGVEVPEYRRLYGVLSARERAQGL